MKELANQSVLWKKFKRGNQSAFSVLYRHFYPSLYFFALKSMRHEQDARECVQELFVTVWNSRQRLGDVSDVKAYLFKSLRRIIYRYASAPSNDIPLLSENADTMMFSPEDFLIRQEEESYRHDTLAIVLNTLPVRQREAIYLKYYEGLSYPQIAEVLHINYQSAVNLIYQAFQALRQQPALQQLQVPSEQ